MVLSPAGLRPERNCTGEEQQQQQITDPSSRQRGRYKITKPQLSKENFKEKEKLIAGLFRSKGVKVKTAYYNNNNNNNNNNDNFVAVVGERTVPTERPLLVAEVSANFLWIGVPRDQRD
jgi:hypothetical protein